MKQKIPAIMLSEVWQYDSFWTTCHRKYNKNHPFVTFLAKKMSNVLFVFQNKCSLLIDFGAHAYIV